MVLNTVEKVRMYISLKETFYSRNVEKKSEKIFTATSSKTKFKIMELIVVYLKNVHR